MEIWPEEDYYCKILFYAATIIIDVCTCVHTYVVLQVYSILQDVTNGLHYGIKSNLSKSLLQLRIWQPTKADQLSNDASIPQESSRLLLYLTVQLPGVGKLDDLFVLLES